MEEGFDLCMTGDFAPLLNMVAKRGAKADMADTGPHWLKDWTLLLALAFMGFWERAFENECTGKQKGSWFFPLPLVGGMSTVTSRPTKGGQHGPVSGGLKAQTLKDVWSWAATGDQLSHQYLWYFWMGKEVPGATLNWTGRRWQGDFSLGVLEELNFEAETSHYFKYIIVSDV